MFVPNFSLSNLFDLCLFCSWQCKSATVLNTDKYSRGINPPLCCQCSSRWTDRETTHTAAIYTHPHKWSQKYNCTSENHKLLKWICNLIAEAEIFIPPKLHICFFNAFVSAAFLWIHYWINFFKHKWEQETVSAVVFLSSWCLSVLYLVGGKNLSQTDSLGSFCIKGCLSGQSAG